MNEQELAQVEHALGGKNYGNYRERLHSVNPPLLPYLYAVNTVEIICLGSLVDLRTSLYRGVYLTDLTFIEDGETMNHSKDLICC